MKPDCDHRGKIETRKKPKGKLLLVAGQCKSCLAQCSPGVVVERGSKLERAAQWWLKKRNPAPGKKKREQRKTYKTKHWDEIRQERLALDDYTCQSCNVYTTEVHHLPSAEYGNEKVEDVITCCSTCNQEERRLRVTKAVLG